MKINKGIAVAVAALSIVGLAACGNSNAASGTTDTKADKGLDVIGNTITYDPNHLVNDGKPTSRERRQANPARVLELGQQGHGSCLQDD